MLEELREQMKCARSKIEHFKQYIVCTVDPKSKSQCYQVEKMESQLKNLALHEGKMAKERSKHKCYGKCSLAGAIHDVHTAR